MCVRACVRACIGVVCVRAHVRTCMCERQGARARAREWALWRALALSHHIPARARACVRLRARVRAFACERALACVSVCDTE